MFPRQDLIGKDLQMPLSPSNEIFENLNVTRLLGMISGMPKLKKFQKSQGYKTFRYDFRYAKIDKISNLNNFAKSKYFFLKLYIQRVYVYPVSPHEF